MRKNTFGLCLLILLLCVSLIGCDSLPMGDTDNPAETTGAPTDGAPVGGYEIVYEPYGNGQCTVKEIKIDGNAKDLTLTIPEIAPNGDRVVEYSCESLSNQSIPRVMTDADFQTLVVEPLDRLVEQGECSEYEKDYLKACYIYRSLDKASTETIRQRWLKEDPILEYTDLWILDRELTGQELAKIARVVDRLEIPFAKRLESMQSIIALGESHGLATSLYQLPVNANAISAIVLPDSVQRINWAAFAGMTNLVSISLPSALTHLSDEMLLGCVDLKTVAIPDGVRTVGQRTFAGCFSLEEIQIPASVNFVDQTAFENSGVLVRGEDGVSYVDTWLIEADRSASEITVRPGTVGICEEAFRGCDELETLVLPDSLLVVGDDAFLSCERLICVEEGGMSYLGSENNPHLILMKCNDPTVSEVTLAESTKIIYDRAFSGCKVLATVELNDVLSSIGKEAFFDCDLLTEINFPGTLKKLGVGVFLECEQMSLFVFGSTKDQWDLVYSIRWFEGLKQFRQEFQPIE